MTNPLIIFDFDDTLFKTADPIIIIHCNNSKTKLCTYEFPNYQLKPGDTLDYSQFEKSVNVLEILPHFDLMLDAIDNYGPEKIVVLTARHDAKPPLNLLKKFGLQDIEVFAVGMTSPEAKANWIRDRIVNNDHDYLEFYDDNEKNIFYVEKLRDEFPLITMHIEKVHHIY